MSFTITTYFKHCFNFTGILLLFANFSTSDKVEGTFLEFVFKAKLSLGVSFYSCYYFSNFLFIYQRLLPNLVYKAFSCKNFKLLRFFIGNGDMLDLSLVI